MTDNKTHALLAPLFDAWVQRYANGSTRPEAFSALEKATAAVVDRLQLADEYDHLFELQQRAKMRAIKQWQRRHGQPDVWPDLTAMLVDMLKQRDAHIAALKGARDALDAIPQGRRGNHDAKINRALRRIDEALNPKKEDDE